ncbi:hypothetical protein F2Q69_00021484 [Brassica cretica]|uniref:Uncharacterized protein n=1 Tax=Brassica cretica TaxID=69181 RepID=A0A8S9Q3U1_BRACR|nr:hypothetical protein F2Q69_00021484 [Brassica cretica]
MVSVNMKSGTMNVLHHHTPFDTTSPPPPPPPSLLRSVFTGVATTTATLIIITTQLSVSHFLSLVLSTLRKKHEELISGSSFTKSKSIASVWNGRSGVLAGKSAGALVIYVLSLPKQTHLFLLREKTLRCAFPGIESSLSKDLAVALNDSEFPQVYTLTLISIIEKQSSMLLVYVLKLLLVLHGELDTGRRQGLRVLWCFLIPLVILEEDRWSWFRSKGREIDEKLDGGGRAEMLRMIAKGY